VQFYITEISFITWTSLKLSTVLEMMYTVYTRKVTYKWVVDTLVIVSKIQWNVGEGSTKYVTDKSLFEIVFDIFYMVGW